MDQEAIRKAIKENPVFAELSDSQLDLLVARAKPKYYAQGQPVFKKGQESATTFCLIVSGTLNVLKGAGEVVRTLSRPEIVGEIAPQSPQHQRICDVTAGEAAELLEWTTEEITREIPALEKKLKDLAWDRFLDYEQA